MNDSLLKKTLILCVVLFSGCAQQPSVSESTATEDQSQVAILTDTPEPGSSPDPTTEIGEDQKTSPTEAAIDSTADVQLTPFPTSGIPFLSANEYDAIHQQLIDPNCQLPCYLGITPGTTSSTSAQESLTDLGARYLIIRESSLATMPFQIIHFYLSAMVGDEILSHDISLFTQGDLVRRIDISVRSTNPLMLVQGWERFELINMLKQYGVPERIFTLPGKDGGNSILFNYDANAIAIAYYGRYRQDTLVCPAFKEEVTTGLDMVLVEPASLQLFAEIEDWPNLFFFQENADTNGIWVSTPTSLGITAGEFYEALLLDEEACFQRSN